MIEGYKSIYIAQYIYIYIYTRIIMHQSRHCGRKGLTKGDIVEAILVQRSIKVRCEIRRKN